MGAEALLALLFVVKIGLYVSALVAGGASLHAALGIVEEPQRGPMISLAGIAAVLAIAFAGARLLIINAQLGAGLGDAFNAANFAWTWAMQGPAALALASGAIAVWFCLVLKSRLLMMAGAVGIAASFALTGHGQALETPGAAPWAIGVHVLIAAFWFAAPISLWPSASLDDSAIGKRMERFGAWAVAAIPILFVLGVWLIWRLAGGVAAALTSSYGQLLLAKLVAASIALALGAFNKIYVSQAIRTAPMRGRRLLARTLSLDAALFATAIALVAWATTMTGPPDM